MPKTIDLIGLELELNSLFKLDARINVYEMAVETAERRGVLTAF